VRARRARLLLAVLGLAAGALLAEAALRTRAYLAYRGTLSSGRALPPDPLPGSRVRLGQLIRRSAHHRLVYELRPGLRVVYEGGAVSTNADGFRGPDRVEARPAGVLRIVGLGDSFMFGQGVHDEETHLALLERRLGSAEVLNLAVPGYNAAMEVEALERKGLRYQPDLVLIEFLGNDLDLPNFIAADPQVLSPRRWFLRDFVDERLARRERPLPADDSHLAVAPRRPDDAALFERDPSRVPAPYRDLVGWPAVETAYRRLAEMGQEHGFRVALLHWQSSAAEPRLVRLARELDLPVLNLSEPAEAYARAHGFASWADSPLVLGQGDNHPSALGHRVTSEAVYGFLVDSGLAPR
jgi:hypothetical protein